MARIGIDIDDTITDTTGTLKKYIEKYDQDYSNDKVLINNLYNIIRGFFVNDTIIKFFKDHSIEMAQKLEVREGAVSVIKKLKEDGHTIYIISARSDEYYGNTEEFCKKYLDSKGIIYDKVITSQLFKIDACRKENIDIMIDDGVDTCDDLNSNNIKAFLYSTEVNEDIETSSPRVYTWKEVYESINKELNNK